jgi:hypothetical protein
MQRSKMSSTLPLSALTRRVASVSLMLSLSMALGAEDPFDSLATDDLEDRVASVNEGDLRFLVKPPPNRFHHHSNFIDISALSLNDGWVMLRQCHENIDPVPTAQVVFRPGGIRALRIVSAENIGKAWVQGHTIQLEDVRAQAKLCVSAESRAFHALGGGVYGLRNGPFMRRFLDGFYPLRVHMEISYPPEILELMAHQPETQNGFSVDQRTGGVSVDTLFDGRLFTCFLFCDRRVAHCAADASECDVLSER